jgi:23S rRNA (uracil1939-C5)-methyltransferase
MMVMIAFDSDQPDLRNALLAHIAQKFAHIVTSIFYFINPKLNETLDDIEPQHYYGTHYITEKLGHLKFNISPKSFFQTNSTQALELYEITKKMAQLTGTELVYDLYTGTGSIAQFVANQARHVVGVEYSQDAINDAYKNAELNNITNCSFFAGDMRAVLNDDFVAEHGTPDVIITDPPRAGMHPDVVAMMLRLAPQRIVYVSCNPATQARDVHTMQHQYRVAAYQPVDMFPHTHHVENVLVLEKIM